MSGEAEDITGTVTFRCFIHRPVLRVTSFVVSQVYLPIMDKTSHVVLFYVSLKVNFKSSCGRSTSNALQKYYEQ